MIVMLQKPQRYPGSVTNPAELCIAAAYRDFDALEMVYLRHGTEGYLRYLKSSMAWFGMMDDDRGGRSLMCQERGEKLEQRDATLNQDGE
jgi:hypothetical protein